MTFFSTISGPSYPHLGRVGSLALGLLAGHGALAQRTSTEDWWTSAGVVGTMVLLGLVLFVAALIITAQVGRLLREAKEKRAGGEPQGNADGKEVAGTYKLRGDELGGGANAVDDKALITRATS